MALVPDVPHVEERQVTERPSLHQLTERFQHRLEILRRAILEGHLERRELPRAPVEEGGPRGGFTA